MQLFALDKKNELFSSKSASKQVDYFCLECGGLVRLRGGFQRQLHFYHVDPSPSCRQHQKGTKHIALQSYFLLQLKAFDCRIECPFPEIGRIADVAYFSEKIVFEIQYSPISKEEVLSRIADYRSIGWDVVWILHDDRYNKWQLTQAEIALRSYLHYFSNMDAFGRGTIYDQFSLMVGSQRKHRLPPLEVNITGIRRELSSMQPFSYYCLEERRSNGDFFFEGDMISCFLRKNHEEYFLKVLEIESEFLGHKNKGTFWEYVVTIFRKYIQRPYLIIFRTLLERMCR